MGTRAAKTIAFSVAAVAMVLVCIEGVASIAFGLLTDRETRDRPVAERLHTRFDPEIGWVGAANVLIPDMYGPGISVQTNERGFRSERPREPMGAAGFDRIICAGDSFTFGYGVSNADTWCALLEEQGNRRVRTVNMGLGGFGLDQTYLWYRREAPTIPHALTIVALVFEDLERMMSDDFLGYGKPIMRVRNGRLTVDNVPVPESTIGRRLAPAIAFARGFKSFELLSSLLRRFRSSPGPASAGAEEMLALSAEVMEAIRDESARHGSVPVFVYLPTEADYRPGSRDLARQRLSVESARLGVTFIDLVPALRRLSIRDMATMFIPPGVMEYAYAAGHYTVRGNRFVRDAIIDEARRHPRLRLLQGEGARVEPEPGD